MSTRWNNQQYNMCYHWWGSCFKLLVLYVGWPWNYASRVVIPMPPFPIASFSCFMSRAMYTFFKNSVKGCIVVLKTWGRGTLHGKKKTRMREWGHEAWLPDWSSSMGLSVVHIKELERVERSISVNHKAYPIRCVCYLHLFTRTTHL